MIDYSLISASNAFFEQAGFRPIETPWTVSQGIGNITKPPDSHDFKLQHDDNKVLVASGEQGFLYLMTKGYLAPGQYQTTTPCFRKEPFDLTHSKYFMKTELISTVHANLTLFKLKELVAKAYENFKLLGATRLEIVQVGDISYDIYNNGIEIGSYGMRYSGHLSWMYGTGIAEPRFSRTLYK